MPTNNNIEYGPAPVPGGPIPQPILGNNIDRGPAPVPAGPATGIIPVVAAPVVPVTEQPVVVPVVTKKPVVPVSEQPVDIPPVIATPILPIYEQPVEAPPIDNGGVIPVIEQPVEPSGAGNTSSNVIVPVQQRYIVILQNGNVVSNNTSSLNFSGNAVTVTKSGNYSANIVINSAGGGGNADLGNWAFTNNTLYNYNGGAINNSDLSHGATAVFTLPSNGSTSAISLLNYYGNIVLTSGTNPGSTNAWTFGSNGNLTLPSNTAGINYANGQPYGVAGNTSPGGTNTQVQFNDSGVFAGHQNFTFDKDTDTLQVPANLIVDNIYSVDSSTVHVHDNLETYGDMTAVGYYLTDGGSFISTDGNTLDITAHANLQLTTNGGQIWKFDTTGNLTLPANTFQVNYANGVAVSLAGTYTNSNVTTLLGSFGSNTVSTTGNITGGYLFGNGSQLTGLPPAYGDSNVTSLLGSFGSNTVSTTGNITGGNFITPGTVHTPVVTNTNGSLTLQAASGYDLVLDPVAANISASSNWINSLADPIQPQDAATKKYVDDNSAGLNIHDPVLLATTEDLATYTGATVTYNNGTNGVGATLSFSGNTLTTLDGTSITGGSSTRLLIKNEGNAVWNGVYNYTSSSQLTRATDMDQPAEISGGDYVFVQTGATQASSSWVEQGAVGNVGVGDINFVQFSASQSYSAGNALTLFGSQFNVLVDGTTVGINGSNQLRIGTVPVANVSGLANVATSGSYNDLSNVPTNLNQFTNGPGYITSATANVISVNGQTGTVTVTEYSNTAVANYLSSGTLSSNITTTGNVSGNYILGNGAYLTGVASSYGNADVANFLANYGSNIVVTTGNITGGNIIGTFIAPGSNTQVMFNDAGVISGNANMTFAKTTGNLNVTGNIIASGDIWATSGNIRTGATTANIVNATSTTVNIAGGASIATNIGNASGVVSLSGNVQGNTNGFAIGYRDIPQVSFTGNTTIALSDAGKHYYSTQSSNFTLTVPNNASAGFAVGSAINLINQGTGTITVAQGVGVTMYFAGNSTSGNRTVSSYGMATLQKVATDTWFIVGVGVT